MTKTVDKTSANPGDTLTYTVTLTNNQPNSDNNVSVEDFLPAGVTLVSATADQGNVDTTGAPTIAWDVGDIAAGDTVRLTIVVTVDADAPSSLRNRASKRTGAQPFVPPDNQCAQTGPTQHDACVTTTVVPEGTYVLTKTVDKATAQPGDTLTYTITVRNPDGAIAGPVTLADTLPTGVTYVSSSASPTPPSTVTGPVAGVLTWSFAGGLPADSTAVLNIVVTVDTDAPDTLTDRVAATAGPTPDVPAANRCPGESNAACATTTVRRQPHIRIVKHVHPSVAKPGQRVRYVIHVTNRSTFPVSNVQVDDDLSGVLDDAVYNNDAHATSGTTSVTPPILRWTGSLAAGQTVVIRYSVTVRPQHHRHHGKGCAEARWGGHGDGCDGWYHHEKRKLVNRIVSPTPGSNCGLGSRDPACVAVVRVAFRHVRHHGEHRHHGKHHGRRELAYTGAANVTPMLLSGLGLLAGGLLLLVAARPRRRSGEEA